jgi:rRNA-processing protein CGR1
MALTFNEEGEWQPAQYPRTDVGATDLRRLVGVAPKGYKVQPLKSTKRKRQEPQEEDEAAAAAGPAPMQDEDEAPGPSEKRQKADDASFRRVSPGGCIIPGWNRVW